ncbi:alpha-N-arabinofuranosidase [Streptomyces scopuliridis]|uniref:arabinosylfuranosidase ArfA n=1 Tax=Streptomyces scopuliridis TaxID=452529 RepID=UPI002DDA0DC1|nr:alpha-N-arabinofuranosidase [Streptomyces scopuliridis]WSB37956.1 alpha-N-arabinofuranosidase [Streptomyces scopuliridis]
MIQRSAARFTLDPAFGIGEVNPRLYGSFVEHLGRCVYDGLYEPGHPEADEAGLRRDVLALVRELGVTTVRYPGGNFVSGYRWEDGVGPLEQRPVRLDLAWHSLETNRFGLGEFMDFCRKTDVEPMMAVNLGTRGVEDAVRLVEYANHPGGTELSDLRIAHGAEEPYGIRMWCLGNEMDGPWQIGHKKPGEYARLARETANAMKMVDGDLQLVACGSSGFGMPTFGAWEAAVLGECYEQVEYVSLHSYYGLAVDDTDLDSFLASAEDVERYIEGVVDTCDHIGARLKSTKKIMLSYDEWNVWHVERSPTTPPPEDGFPYAPRLLENNYSLADAVLTGSLLIGMLRHADRVTAASLAQLVNVIAPIMTEPGGPAWRQTIFYPFAQASAFGRGRVLRVEADSPRHTTERFGEVDLLHATAVTDDATGAVTVFAVNRDRTGPLPLDVVLRGFGELAVAEHLVLDGDDPDARNTLDRPDRVTPRTATGATVSGDVLRAVLTPLSWNVIRLRRPGNG